MIHHLIAYIDPGSMSLIFQAAVAAIVAIPIFFRHQIGRVIGKFRRPTEAQTVVDDRPDGD